MLIRGIGPSLVDLGVDNPLLDPVIELHESGLIAANDNWQDDAAQAALITASTLPPTNPNESAMVQTLDPGSYTVIMKGKADTVGVGLVEIYDLAQGSASELANISTRGIVGTNSGVMIGGFILGGTTNDSRVLIRAIGPSLTEQDVSDALPDPTLELHGQNGDKLVSNDNWQDDSDQAAKITASGVAPTNPLESAIYAELPPGNYTAVVAGKDGATGVALVEVYHLP